MVRSSAMGTSLFSPTHLVILLLVVLLLFGAKRLPEIGRSLGVGMREFKDSVTGVQEATNLNTPARRSSRLRQRLLRLRPPLPWPSPPSPSQRLSRLPSQHPSAPEPEAAEAAEADQNTKRRCRGCRGSGFRVAWTMARKRRSSSTSTSFVRACSSASARWSSVQSSASSIHSELIHWLELTLPKKFRDKLTSTRPVRVVHDSPLDLDLVRCRSGAADAALAGLGLLHPSRRRDSRAQMMWLAFFGSVLFVGRRRIRLLHRAAGGTAFPDGLRRHSAPLCPSGKTASQLLDQHAARDGARLRDADLHRSG